MCEHKDFAARVEVNRIENIGRFQADVTIQCAECGVPFRFLGMPRGLNFDGATMSVDTQTAILSIYPVGEMPPKVTGVRGYSVKLPETKTTEC